MDAFADLVLLIAAAFLSFFAALWLARVALSGLFQAMPILAKVPARLIR